MDKLPKEIVEAITQLEVANLCFEGADHIDAMMKHQDACKAARARLEAAIRTYGIDQANAGYFAGEAAAEARV